MNGEPGALVLGVFADLIGRIKQCIPTDSNDRPLGTMVYSQLVLGMPVIKADYFDPWNPQGDMIEVPPPDPQAQGSEEAQRKARRQNAAAWKTCLLANTLLEVTKDGKYRQYPIGRNLAFAYDKIINGMQADPPPPMPDDGKARMEAATRVLYKVNADGVRMGRTELYDNYLKLARAYAKAKGDYAVAAEAAIREGRQNEWAVTAGTYRQDVDDARDALSAAGEAEIQAALATLGSVALPVNEMAIKAARDKFKAWQLDGIAGVVAEATPYSLVLPSNWCDPANPEGFEGLSVTQSQYQHIASTNWSSAESDSWHSEAQSSSGGGAVSFGFFAVGGEHSEAETKDSYQNSQSSGLQSVFHNTAKNLTIKLEYALCSFYRPWLVSDIFYLQNWKIPQLGGRHCISDGTIDGQADSQDKWLPMIPQQVLVVRNVEVSSTDWGSDGAVLSEFYASAEGQTTTQTSETAGMGGVALGFVNFGGRAGSQSAESSGSSGSRAAASSHSYFGTTFDKGVLKIPGAQIVAFLSDIVPACPNA